MSETVVGFVPTDEDVERAAEAAWGGNPSWPIMREQWTNTAENVRDEVRRPLATIGPIIARAKAEALREAAADAEPWDELHPAASWLMSRALDIEMNANAGHQVGTSPTD